MLKPGDPAPDFAVGQTTLHQLLLDRRVVVFFFPKAFTPGWTREAGGFRRDYAKFTDAGVEVVGVSKDDQATSDRFRAALELPYPLVGDPTGRVLGAYDVRIPVLGLAQRVTYVIGQDRRILETYASAFDALSHVATACQVVLRKPGS